MSYYFHELLMLDAGSWFNETSPEQARPPSPSSISMCRLSATRSAYAEGKKLNRDANGARVISYRIKDKYKDMTLSQIREAMPQSNTWLSWVWTSPTPTYPTRRQRQPPRNLSRVQGVMGEPPPTWCSSCMTNLTPARMEHHHPEGA